LRIRESRDYITHRLDSPAAAATPRVVTTTEPDAGHRTPRPRPLSVCVYIHSSSAPVHHCHCCRRLATHARVHEGGFMHRWSHIYISCYKYAVESSTLCTRESNVFGCIIVYVQSTMCMCQVISCVRVCGTVMYHPLGTVLYHHPTSCVLCVCVEASGRLSLATTASHAGGRPLYMRLA
jgi:hypothetical protein